MKVIRAIFRKADMISQPAAPSRRTRILTHKVVATMALSSVVSCAMVSLGGCKGQSFSIGPSTGEVVGVTVGVIAVVGGTTAVLIAVHHSHHTVKGCVSSVPGGLQVATGDKKTYRLTGNTRGLATGSLVKLHGNKIKRSKNGTGDMTFEVQKLVKDYGSCQVSASTTASLADLDEVPPAK